MIFSKLTRIIAVLVLVLGIADVVIGFTVASIEPNEAREAAAARYLGNRSTGQAIDRGLYSILIALALGTLAEISFSMRKFTTASGLSIPQFLAAAASPPKQPGQPS